MARATKPRSLTSEMLIWIVLLVAVPMLLLIYYFYTHMMDELTNIEREKTAIANRSAQKMIEGIGESILGVTISNGYWEDNRQAMLKRDMNWLITNINVMPEVVPNVDFVAQTDVSGHIVVQAGDIRQFTDKLQYPVILERFRIEREFTGVVDTSKGAALIAVAPVTGDQGQEEPVGLLITGRLLNRELMKDIGDTLQAEVGLFLRSGQFLASSDDIAETELKAYASMLETGTDDVFRLTKREGLFYAEDAAPLADLAGNPIGIVYTASPSESTTRAAQGWEKLSYYALGIMLLLVVLVVYLLRRRIIVPLRHFTRTLEQVASGQDAVDIPKHILEAEAEILTAIRQIMRWNQSLEQTVKERTTAIRNLLDNASQGFMTVGTDLRIGEQYSIECTRLFGREVGGQSFPSLLYPQEESERSLLESIFADYFAEREAFKREVLFSLLPEEAAIGERTVRLEYKPIETGETIMVILSDITEKRVLERQMNRERQTLRMVVQVVTHSDDYAEIIRDYESFYRNELPEIAGSEQSAKTKLSAVAKRVHTLKGNLSLLSLLKAPSHLHQLEDRLNEKMRAQTERDGALEHWLLSLPFERWIEEDVAVLQSVIGESFLRQSAENRIEIDASAWRRLEAKLEAVLPGVNDDNGLLNEFRQWRLKPIRHLLKTYPAYMAKLAERAGKSVRVTMEGVDRVRVDPERFAGFAKSLVHVFRNIAVHGIEPPEDRLEQGKDWEGTIAISAEAREGALTLMISDDGRGVDMERIRLLAAERGLLQKREADEAEAERLLELLFSPGFSTAVETNELAGRGVGLAAVKDEVDKLGGTVRLNSQPGEGTQVVFEFPNQMKD
jgi:signal transduction histidine kinase